jgi:hypothetical protein
LRGPRQLDGKTVLAGLRAEYDRLGGGCQPDCLGQKRKRKKPGDAVTREPG